MKRRTLTCQLATTGRAVRLKFVNGAGLGIHLGNPQLAKQIGLFILNEFDLHGITPVKCRKKLPRSLHYSPDGDSWGACQAWRFALADYLLFRRGVDTADFRPSPMGPCRDCWEWKALAYGNYATSTLLRFQRVLNRLSEILKGGGHDY